MDKMKSSHILKQDSLEGFQMRTAMEAAGKGLHHGVTDNERLA
jgi:hypothetical protein